METETEKEHKEDDIVMADSGSSLVSQQLREVRRKDPFNASANGQTSTRQRLVNVLIGNCTGMCASFPMAAERAVGRSTQFVELHGLRFIGLGAMVDELTPKERVYDTLEQLTARSERLISIGYIMKERNHATIAPGPAGALPITKTTAETVPLDVWNQQETNKMTSQVKHLVDLMMVSLSSSFVNYRPTQCTCTHAPSSISFLSPSSLSDSRKSYRKPFASKRPTPTKMTISTWPESLLTIWALYLF